MFQRKTVDDVLRTFNKTISELRAVATVQDKVATTKREQASRLQNEALKAKVESSRADSIADRLSALLDTAE